MATKSKVDVFITFEGVDPEVAQDLFIDISSRYEATPFSFSVDNKVDQVDEPDTCSIIVTETERQEAAVKDGFPKKLADPQYRAWSSLDLYPRLRRVTMPFV